MDCSVRNTVRERDTTGEDMPNTTAKWGDVGSVAWRAGLRFPDPSLPVKPKPVCSSNICLPVIRKAAGRCPLAGGLTRARRKIVSIKVAVLVFRLHD